MVEELEPHLREKILYYLDEKSLSQARLVNKSWYEASNRKVFLQQCIHKVQTYFEEDTGWPVLMSKIIIPDLRILANFMVQNYKMNKDYPRTVFNTAAFVGNQANIDLFSPKFSAESYRTISYNRRLRVFHIVSSTIWHTKHVNQMVISCFTLV